VRSSWAASLTNDRTLSSAARAALSAPSTPSSISSKAVATRPISVSGRCGRRRRPRSPRAMSRASAVISSNGRRAPRTTEASNTEASARKMPEAPAMIHRSCSSVSSTPLASAVRVIVESSLSSNSSVRISVSEVTTVVPVTFTLSAEAALSSVETSGVDGAPTPPGVPRGASPAPGGPLRSSSGVGPAATASPSALSMSTEIPWADNRSARSSFDTVPMRAAAAAARSRSRSSSCPRRRSPRTSCTVKQSATSSTVSRANTESTVRVRSDPDRSAPSRVAGVLIRSSGSRYRGPCG
jgi:hypothetical protein